MLVPAISFAQTSKGWQQKNDFHTFMAATFHPAEDGDFAPLKAKADSMYSSAKAWAASPIPMDYKEKETKVELTKLVKQIAEIKIAIKDNASDADLMKMISSTHDTFHKISGECKKDGGEKH